MSYVLDNLRRFNRKERFYLIGYALDNVEFRLGAHFRAELEAYFGLTIPDNHFAAMDYHLSWLYASLFLDGFRGPGPYPNGGGIEKGNQEDIDLLIAYDAPPKTHVLILEAKGVTGWSNKQLRSKRERLEDIFGSNGTNFPDVQPSFAILSPFQPKLVLTANWPKWMLRKDNLPWLRLPPAPGLHKVTRCDAAGITGASGGYWKVEPDAVSRRMQPVV